MYQALYRKWRPKTFSQVVGQDHITGTLQRQVAEGRTAHAYLFTGTRGTGKTTCARILAKAVNCLHPEDGAPCNQCEACRGIDSGSLLDVTELDAASNSRVDDIRELLSESVYTPTVLKKRVYIIDEVHMLSTQAFNALLKTIEEPPEHLMFILATTELHKVPATILSRCQRFSFKRILPRDMERQLLHIAQAEKIDLTADGAEILSRMAGGALRDALSLLDQCRVAEGQLTSRAVLDVLGLAGSVQTQQMMRCILDRRTPDALLLLDQLYRSGKDVSALLGELSDLAREMTILKAAPEGGSALLSGLYDTKTLTGLSENISMQRLLYLTETLQGARAALPDSFQPRTDVELCLLRLCDESLCGDLTALSARLDRVEELLKKGVPARRERPAAQPAAERPAAPESRTSADSESRPAAAEKRPPAPEEVPWEEPPLPDEPAGRERVFDIPEESQRPSAPKPTHRAPRRSVSADPAPSAPAGDSRLWTQLLDQFKGRLPVNHRVFLNMASGTVEGDCLTVHCRNDFVRDSLNNRTVLAVLEEVTSAAVGSPIRVMLTVGGETPSAPRSTRSAPKPPRPAPEQTPTPEEERPPLPEEPPLPAEPSRPPEPKAEEERPPLPEEPSAQEENAPPWEGGSKDRLEELIGPGSQLEHFKIK